MGYNRYSSVVSFVNQKQIIVFVVIGSFLLALDSIIFLLLSFTAIDTTIINIVSKSGAAVVGYFLHYKYTFQSENNWQDQSQIFRYTIYLIIMILISTFLINISELLVDGFRAYPLTTLLVKIIVESICVVISFVISKTWVYISWKILMSSS